MFSVLEFIGIVLDILAFLLEWRFNLCLSGGAALAAVAVALIPYEPLGWMVAAAIFTAGFIVGLRWDRDHRRGARLHELQAEQSCRPLQSPVTVGLRP